MLQWINENDERNYFNGRFGVEKFNKACAHRREEYPYNKNSHSDIVNNIKTKGYHIVKNIFDVNTLLSLKQEADSIIESGNNLKLNNIHWQVVDQPLINCSKTAFDLATDNLLVNIASEFFGCTPALGTLNLRRSRINSSPEDTTNLFHIDPNSIKFLKFFLYLNDVKEIEDGPLTLVEGSHNRKFIGWQSKYRWTKDEIASIYGEEKIKYMLANVGDLIIATTTAFHRGTKVKSRDRTMYTINYVVHPEEFKKPVFKVKKEHVDMLSKDKKPIVDFLLKV